jgi:hypothetical protein
MNSLADLLEKLRQEGKGQEAQPSTLAGQKPAMKKGGKVSSASKRADGIAQKGKTRGKIV